MHLLPHLQATTCRIGAGTCYGPHSITPGGVPNTNIVRNVPRLPNSSANYRGGQSSRPIHTSHNSHTHTDITHQSEPQLKDSSCSSAISSHNPRDVIPSHSSRNVTCLTLIPSHNSRDMFGATTQGTLQLEPCRPRTPKVNKSQVMPLYYRLALLLSH